MLPVVKPLAPDPQPASQSRNIGANPHFLDRPLAELRTVALAGGLPRRWRIGLFPRHSSLRSPKSVPFRRVSKSCTSPLRRPRARASGMPACRPGHPGGSPGMRQGELRLLPIPSPLGSWLADRCCEPGCGPADRA
jgi:hypothetical protein